jgi:hypothetical protein
MRQGYDRYDCLTAWLWPCEMCLVGGLGSTPAALLRRGPDAALFGEAQSRILVAVPARRRSCWRSPR